MGPDASAGLLFMAGSALYDLRYRRIHPVYTAAFGVCGLLAAAMSGREAAEIAGALLPGLLLLLFSFLTRGAVGAGDGIALAVLGLYVETWDLLISCCLGFFLASAAAGFLFLKNRRGRDELPFLPFLFAGMLLGMLV